MRIATDEQEGGDDGMVNLTPLIDVVFLLLIFFMVTTTFQEDERDLQVTVPEAEGSSPVKELPETMVVSVRQSGDLRVGGKSLDKSELRQLLTRAKRKNRKQRVIVRTDKDAPARFPVAVLGLCVALGIPTSIATAPPVASPGG